MAAGDPWQGAKYSYGVWERFPDQENQFLKNHVFVKFGTHLARMRSLLHVHCGPLRIFLFASFLGPMARPIIWAGPIWAGPIWARPIWAGPIWAGPIWAGPIWAGPIILWARPIWAGPNGPGSYGPGPYGPGSTGRVPGPLRFDESKSTNRRPGKYDLSNICFMLF